MNSHNHPMLGSITAWFYRALAGLRMDLPVNSCLRFVIQPTLVEGINAASAELETMAGRASTQWRRTANGFEIDVEVPVNSLAVLCVPNTPGTTPLVVRMNDNIIWSERDSARYASGVMPGTNAREAMRLELASGQYCVRVDREPAIEASVYLPAKVKNDTQILSDSR
jgi:alpha-L-rhamnosidase